MSSKENIEVILFQQMSPKMTQSQTFILLCFKIWSFTVLYLFMMLIYFLFQNSVFISDSNGSF